jgi:hypothetical protein
MCAMTRRAASCGFTHQSADGTAQPALDQAFGYDENDRITGITTNAANWTNTHDLNGNRTGLSLMAASARTPSRLEWAKTKASERFYTREQNRREPQVPVSILSAPSIRTLDLSTTTRE